MIVINKRISVNSRADKIYLIPLGDVHIGTKNCSEKQFVETVKWIQEKENCYWVGMGDYCEFINYSDKKRFDPENIHPRFLPHLAKLATAQADHFISLVKPIADKCIGILEGNHEETIKKQYHNSITDYIAMSLNTRNLGYCAMIRLDIVRSNGASQRLIIYAHHGHGGSGTPGNAINTLMQTARSFEADIFLMGHVHRKIGISQDRLFLNNSLDAPLLLEKKQLFGITGCFYNAYKQDCSSYAEKKGYAPSSLGTLKITIDPFRCKKIGGKSVDLSPHIHISE